MHAENRTHIAAAAEPSEVVVLSKFILKINNTEGELNVVMPHGLLDPLRPLLASGVKKGHTDSDENWRYNLQRKLEEVEIDINAIFAQADISLGELFSLKVADFIPVNMSETTLVYSEDVPLFEGKIGMSNQQAAVRVGQLHHH
jgi:flagellar motor switch protein FliM